MGWFGGHGRTGKAPAPIGPVLDLSGPRLRQVFEHLIDAAEETGGVERYVGALTLKASLFEEVLGKGRVGELTETEFCDLCAFMAPVRRRIGAWLANNGFPVMRLRLKKLLEGWSDLGSADRRLMDFVASFPTDRAHRWVRDLAAEMLHFTAPSHYPLMTRWIWDAEVRTGVLREIWYAADVDAADIQVDDSLATFAMLRSELESFLADNGVFRDLPFYVDLLCAQAYAEYLGARGGLFLRADFCGKEEPMAHTRRMLGLDAVHSESGRSRLKLIDGQAHVLGETRRLS